MVTNKSQNRPLRAGELAALTGVSTDTLRHYERKGVLPKPDRSESGYRQYPAEAAARVHLVRKALAIGFTLDELAAVLQAKDRGGVPCREVRAIATSRLEALEAQMRAMAILRDELRALLQEWDQQLTAAKGEQARLLESWAASAQTDGEPSLARSPRRQIHGKRGK